MESAKDSQSQRPVFWKELYWFAVISLFGITLALVVVPPRASRLLRLRRLEAEMKVRQAELDEREQVLHAAIDSFENDIFYRDVVFRKVLDTKRNSEEFLDIPAPRVR